jgi:hypothetical protein
MFCLFACLTHAESAASRVHFVKATPTHAMASVRLMGSPALLADSQDWRAVGTWSVTLPPQEKPTTHWPWWLRILAVIGVLLFIRIVAGSVRNKPSGPAPS